MLASACNLYVGTLICVSPSTRLFAQHERGSVIYGVVKGLDKGLRDGSVLDKRLRDGRYWIRGCD